MSGGYSNYETGSYIESYNLSFMTGYVKGFDLAKNKRLTLGAFAEFGRSDYTTHNDTEGGGEVQSDGSNKYYGLGILSRLSFSNGIYTEVSIHGGLADANFESDDIGTDTAKYKTRSPYYGGHLGIGYFCKSCRLASPLNFTNRPIYIKRDTYLKFIHSVQTGDEVTLNDQSKISFDDTTSNRILIGTRTTYKSIYGGIAYQYELEGTIDATTSDLAIDSPSLKGGSAMAELGYTKKLGQWDINLGLKGYYGVRRDLSLSGSAVYEF